MLLLVFFLFNVLELSELLIARGTAGSWLEGTFQEQRMAHHVIIAPGTPLQGILQNGHFRVALWSPSPSCAISHIKLMSIF